MKKRTPPTTPVNNALSAVSENESTNVTQRRKKAVTKGSDFDSDLDRDQNRGRDSAVVFRQVSGDFLWPVFPPITVLPPPLPHSYLHQSTSPPSDMLILSNPASYGFATPLKS
ncbi:hypothetical protein EVAR_87690_1 [Eumeta japonica]|uniref:Uncharacterized protein n=1 Tax=Eumeta variegata TaxID=151549 RepID=A0A4C1XKN7_EUMVA|nr:hypothetical protein EVAR_87690_1 [Eumeta japonica]